MKNEELIEQITKEMDEAMDKQFSDCLDKFIDDNAHEMQYDSKKQQIDSVYLHNIKNKIEVLLDKIIEKFDLSPYLSIKKRYRLDENLWHESKYKKLYDTQKDIDGKYLASGYDYIPIDFEDWTKTYFPDYTNVVKIYSNTCEHRRVLKDDLKILNKIARRYIKDTNDGNN